jgi:hypothetical protein
MKIITILLVFSSPIWSQNLTQEDQKKLIEENIMLREELKKQQASPQVPANVMNALQKGQKFQEEQNNALQELAKEE